MKDYEDIRRFGVLTPQKFTRYHNSDVMMIHASRVLTPQKFTRYHNI